MDRGGSQSDDQSRFKRLWQGRSLALQREDQSDVDRRPRTNAGDPAIPDVKEGPIGRLGHTSLVIDREEVVGYETSPLKWAVSDQLSRKARLARPRISEEKNTEKRLQWTECQTDGGTVERSHTFPGLQSGRATEKRAPLAFSGSPSSSRTFWHQIAPWWLSTICRAIASPSPEFAPNVVPRGRDV